MNKAQVEYIKEYLRRGSGYIWCDYGFIHEIHNDGTVACLEPYLFYKGNNKYESPDYSIHHYKDIDVDNLTLYDVTDMPHDFLPKTDTEIELEGLKKTLEDSI